MKYVLITGGAGFVASSLAESLLSTGNYYVIAIDNFLTGCKKHISDHPNYKFIKGDVNNYRDISAVMLNYRFDYVFHYAAVVGVLRTLDHPKMVLDDIMGLQHVFELSKNTGVERIFFSSSSEVYGEPVHLPQHEYVTPLNSRLPYAVVKNIGECFCRSYHDEFGLDYTILRFFNTYGPRQSQDFVVAKFLNAAVNNEAITIYGDGSQTRTFCYIDDNLEFTRKILEEHLFVNDVVNVGNNKLTTVKELAETIIRITESSSKITYLPPLKEGDMTRRQPDNTKMIAVLNRPLLKLEDGILNIINQSKRITQTI
ncbi:NAD-dependent epimerase/dehydratase family protein [Agriterribacter sp.]|uniref:NAD-dependent epimerase/dehydratase family protein n=1 Tax=Agriterribacter sp. TaxID=2821509 RepID=UPI002D0D7FBE|nr:NAD-dependent epimerase/dehydratase family protein [Agriterribacter sp.]HRO44570.1 NAD-dependent epimerase/dehydratase family protein [Agriterribacter sp.]HRQ16007.1 NAD-dependent epimerase/dehydratase family protein [Agriterribacter sp.]